MKSRASNVTCRRARLSIPLLMIAPSLALASCGPDRPPPQPIAIAADDQAALNKRAPGASEAALSDDPKVAAAAKASDDALIERWIMDTEAAWGRMCRSMTAQGVVMPLACPVVK